MIKYSKFTDNVGSGNLTDTFCQNRGGGEVLPTPHTPLSMPLSGGCSFIVSKSIQFFLQTFGSQFEIFYISVLFYQHLKFCRLDEMMENDRLRALVEYEERDNAKRLERLKGAQVLQKQIEENEQHNLLEQEKKDQETRVGETFIRFHFKLKYLITSYPVLVEFSSSQRVSEEVSLVMSSISRVASDFSMNFFLLGTKYFGKCFYTSIFEIRSIGLGSCSKFYWSILSTFY